jgi:hypothetical protein
VNSRHVTLAHVSAKFCRKSSPDIGSQVPLHQLRIEVQLHGFGNIRTKRNILKETCQYNKKVPSLMSFTDCSAKAGPTKCAVNAPKHAFETVTGLYCRHNDSIDFKLVESVQLITAPSSALGTLPRVAASKSPRICMSDIPYDNNHAFFPYLCSFVTTTAATCAVAAAPSVGKGRR